MRVAFLYHQYGPSSCQTIPSISPSPTTSPFYSNTSRSRRTSLNSKRYSAVLARGRRVEQAVGQQNVPLDTYVPRNHTLPRTPAHTHTALSNAPRSRSLGSPSILFPFPCSSRTSRSGRRRRSSIGRIGIRYRVRSRLGGRAAVYQWSFFVMTELGQWWLPTFPSQVRKPPPKLLMDEKVKALQR